MKTAIVPKHVEFEVHPGFATIVRDSARHIHAQHELGDRLVCNIFYAVKVFHATVATTAATASVSRAARSAHAAATASSSRVRIATTAIGRKATTAARPVESSS